MNLHEAIAHIQALPGAQVDRNFGQGEAVVREQLERRYGRAYSDTSAFIADARKTLATLQELAAPAQLPPDYMVFLEHYGGLRIQSGSHELVIDGLGPMTTAWYEGIVGMNPAGFVHTALYIATLSLDIEEGEDIDAARITSPSWRGVECLLDLTGVISKGAVFALGPDLGAGPHPFSVDADDIRVWQQLANSFTAFLARVAATNGLLGYT